ncbi:MAG: MSMEG_1061 family FMN-dependent PPOX-type flavoprotein [Pseudomonadales bacterium]
MSKITTVAQLRSIIGEAHPSVAEKKIDHLDRYARTFIARSPFLVLSTADAQGRVDASPKGDAPGFVQVVDNSTLVIPDRPGNKLAYGHQNILHNPQVGLLFMIPNTAETLRVNGRAELTADAQLLQSLASRGKSAVLAIQVSVEECFFHCAKAFLRSGLWKPESWGERHRVSFGEMFAQRRGDDAASAQGIDQLIEADYRDNL